MLELPEKMRAGIGVQARKFKSRDTGEVDSSWTETPADKERRQRVSHESINSLSNPSLAREGAPYCSGTCFMVNLQSEMFREIDSGKSVVSMDKSSTFEAADGR